MEETLTMTNGIPECPKCPALLVSQTQPGEGFARPRYCRGLPPGLIPGKTSNMAGALCPLQQHGEHLHWTCGVCGYTWVTACVSTEQMVGT